MTGDDGDADVSPAGPGLILMGGSTEPDEAFHWWNGLIAGGDVVILRTSGSDGYNDYLYSDIGGVDSVETLMVTSRALADNPYVAWRIAHAEGIFLAGGDQATYLDNWVGTAVPEAIMEAWARGAVLGGTSAGLAVLGEHAFAAYAGTVTSEESLENPYDAAVQLDRGLVAIPWMEGWITDSHFRERDRLGRLVAFLARLVTDGEAEEVAGIGVGEGTALVVGPDRRGEVVGGGEVYLLRPSGLPTRCEPGAPLEHTVIVQRLSEGDTVELPAGTTSATALTVTASGGELSPANPY